MEQARALVQKVITNWTIQQQSQQDSGLVRELIKLVEEALPTRNAVEAHLGERRPFILGFIGSSGAGKSTLINSLRGIGYDPENFNVQAAPTGTLELERTPCQLQYRHHVGQRVIVYTDIPGLGGQVFPTVEDLDRAIGLKVGFDLFVLVHKTDGTNVSLPQADCTAFKYLTSIGRHVICVCNVTVELKDSLREQITREYQRRFPGVTLFIVSNDFDGENVYDLPQLRAHLESHKTLVAAVRQTASSMLKGKAQTLIDKRAESISMFSQTALSAVAGAIPFASLVMDTVLLSNIISPLAAAMHLQKGDLMLYADAAKTRIPLTATEDKELRQELEKNVLAADLWSLDTVKQFGWFGAGELIEHSGASVVRETVLEKLAGSLFSVVASPFAIVLGAGFGAAMSAFSMKHLTNKIIEKAKKNAFAAASLYIDRMAAAAYV